MILSLILSSSIKCGLKERCGEPDVHGRGDRGGRRGRRRQLAANAALTAKVAADLRARKPSFVATVARGSSDHAALYLKHLVELKVALACASLGPSIASLYHAPLKLEGAVAIAISQSGRSPDILAMLRTAKNQRAMSIAFVNDEGSPLAREADALLPLCAGARALGRGDKVDDRFAWSLAPLSWPIGATTTSFWRRSQSCLRSSNSSSAAPPATEAIETLANASSLFVVGRGATHAIAAEAALKLKETSAIHAEAFSSAEVLHGPAGIIGPGFPVLAFAPADAARPGSLTRSTASPRSAPRRSSSISSRTNAGRPWSRLTAATPC